MHQLVENFKTGIQISAEGVYGQAHLSPLTTWQAQYTSLAKELAVLKPTRLPLCLRLRIAGERETWGLRRLQQFPPHVKTRSGRRVKQADRSKRTMRSSAIPYAKHGITITPLNVQEKIKAMICQIRVITLIFCLINKAEL